MTLYGRECVMPWELEGDLGPLENEEDQELPIEEVIARMYNIREQVLDVAAANIKRSRQGPTMLNTAEMHLKWVKKYEGRIHCGIQNKNH